MTLISPSDGPVAVTGASGYIGLLGRPGLAGAGVQGARLRSRQGQT